jgi:hypothetical protein
MSAASKFAELVRMLESFIHGAGEARGTVFVRQIESELARVGLDDEEEFSDLQRALAIYSGREDDVRDLKSEASFAIRLLSAR